MATPQVCATLSKQASRHTGGPLPNGRTSGQQEYGEAIRTTIRTGKVCATHQAVGPVFYVPEARGFWVPPEFCSHSTIGEAI